MVDIRLGNDNMRCRNSEMFITGNHCEAQIAEAMSGDHRSISGQSEVNSNNDDLVESAIRRRVDGIASMTHSSTAALSQSKPA